MKTMRYNIIIETPTDDMIRQTELWKDTSYFHSQPESPKYNPYFKPCVPKESLDDKTTVTLIYDSQSTYLDIENKILKPHSKSDLPGTFYTSGGQIIWNSKKLIIGSWGCRELWISQNGIPYWFRIVTLNNKNQPIWSDTIYFKTFHGKKIMSVRMTRDKSVKKFVKEATKKMYNDSVIRFMDPRYYQSRRAFYNGYCIKNSKLLRNVSNLYYHDYNYPPIGSYENPLIVDSWIPAIVKNLGA
jgi:hypothetical protein